MILETMPDVKQLTAAEKLLLVSELWDDLAAHPTEVPVSRERIAELDRRMEAYRRDPSQVTTWEAIQQRILGNPVECSPWPELRERLLRNFQRATQPNIFTP